MPVAIEGLVAVEVAVGLLDDGVALGQQPFEHLLSFEGAGQYTRGMGRGSTGYETGHQPGWSMAAEGVNGKRAPPEHVERFSG